jgi:hypothetical protein
MLARLHREGVDEAVIIGEVVADRPGKILVV